jgi:hypothetical protein
MPRKKHWILKRLDYLRQRAREIDGFTSGTTRRRRDLIDLLTAINDSYRDFSWRYNFSLSMSDDGKTGKIILTPTHVFNKGHGKITFEYPSVHNTHRTVFIFAETLTGVDAAQILRKNLARRTMAFEFPLILKEGCKLTPLDPA